MNYQEEWMPIEDFPGYAVSNHGRITNEATGRILTNSVIQYGTRIVSLMSDNVQYRRSVSVLVAHAFILNVWGEHFDTPIHMDGDKNNCRFDNLAWRPRWFAIEYHRERRTDLVSFYSSWHTDIRLNETGEIFGTLRRPAVKYGILQSDIHKSVVNGSEVFPYRFTFDLCE